MKSKKAWLRIVEAFIAIILITSFLLILYSRTIEKPKKSEIVYNLQKVILDEIANDNELRNDVLREYDTEIVNFVSERVPQDFNFSIRICEVEDICGLEEYKEEIYSSERIISSNLTKYEPKKLKLFMWEES